MSKTIGRVNIYDIYTSCFNNLPSSVRRARNPLEELIVGKTGKYYGPIDCIDDHVESKYFNNSEVNNVITIVLIFKSLCPTTIKAVNSIVSKQETSLNHILLYASAVGAWGHPCCIHWKDWRLAHLHRQDQISCWYSITYTSLPHADVSTT